MKLDTLIIACIIAGGLLGMMSTAYYDISASYGVLNITNETNTTSYLDMTADFNDRLELMSNKTKDMSGKGILNIETWVTGVTLVLDIPPLIYETFNLVTGMVEGMGGVVGLPIPPAFTLMITSILGVVVIFGIIGFIRKKP